MSEDKLPEAPEHSATPNSGVSAEECSPDQGPDIDAEEAAGPHAAAIQQLSTDGSAQPQYAIPFPLVGIGASAGGLAAIEAFFAAMPREQETGMAFVLVQHLSPDHKSVLADVVRRYTAMRVYEAKDGMRIEQDCTYIIPPDHDLTLRDGGLHLEKHEHRRRPHLTVDHFFQSLALAQHDRAIGIIMSGTGADGTLGARAIKGEGGVVIAQAPDTAEYDGMPRSVIASGMVDYTLAPDQMPAQLIGYARQAFQPQPRKTANKVGDSVLKKLFLLLRAQTGHDFSGYKETTLLRRMQRRMALHQIDQPDQYVRLAREEPREVAALFRDLLIGVTGFFRDPEAFAVIEQKVIPRLLERKQNNDSIRVWVCGCSTGEEAYSLAILLYDHMRTLKRVFKVQVFATDIDPQAIEHARSGIYTASIAEHVSEERLARYFVHDPQRGTYQIQKYIRDLLVFSEQDVIKDPPFSKLDLLSCRNLLIYLDAELQHKLIALFHYALVPGGFLFLGTSETVGENARLYQVIDRKWKIYLRLPTESAGSARYALPEFVPPLVRAHDRSSAPSADLRPGEETASLRQLTERGLLSHYSPAGLLVDGRGQILHIVGRTGKFLEPADGDASMNVVSMAREGLRRELTVALHEAVAHKRPVSYAGLQVRTNGDSIRANLAVRPIEHAGASLYLVILEEHAPEPPDTIRGAADDDYEGRIKELERELRSKDEYLQTTLEEMETTNEELKSTNEELQSVNEELQSTNEELETSKEELQSVNEELSTVNQELQNKVSELSRANNDMNNLLAGTGVGTVFVDNRIRLSRFTPAATRVINLIEGDVGRPLDHISTNFAGYDRLPEDVARVIETLVPVQAEVQAKSGEWYVMSVRPYRTAENVIEGAVVTLVDISERKRAEDSLRQSQERLEAFVNQAVAGMSELDLDGRFRFVNDRLCQWLGYSREELLGKRLTDVIAPEDRARAARLYGDIAKGGPDFQLDKHLVRKDGEPLRVLERVTVVRDASGNAVSLISVSFELSEKD